MVIQVGIAPRPVAVSVHGRFTDLLAEANMAKAGITNVEFRKGTIEDIPLPDATVDVVISNC